MIHHVDGDVLGGISREIEDAGGGLHGEIRTGLGRLFDNLEGHGRIGISVLRISHHANLQGAGAFIDGIGRSFESNEILARELGDVRAGGQGKSRKTREAYVS